jgi:hypothetical protein
LANLEKFNMSVSYIFLSPFAWTQTIQSDARGGSSRHATAQCSMREGCNFRISTGDNLTQRVVHLSVMAGQPTEANGSPLEGGIGRVFYIPDGSDGEPFVHGWMYLPPDEHAALLQQLTSGAFSDCTIDLTVTPIEWGGEDAVWVTDRGPLLIEAVQLRFTRPTKPTPAPPPKAGLFGRR